MSFTPTEEQKRIVEEAVTGGNIVIKAFAGASKTTTLSLIAKALNALGKRGFYLAFNKAIASEAQIKMPNTVDCRTIHSLAYKYTDNNLKKKLSYRRIFPKDIATRYKLTQDFVRHIEDENIVKKVTANSKASMVSQTINRFCNSNSKEITESHVVLVDWLSGFDNAFDTTRLRNELLRAAKRYWEDIINPENDIPITHDTYLKLFQLKRERLNIDYIMIDENQDSSPVILDIVRNQDCQKIYVGDQYQAIYAWRGAINAMDLVGGKSFYLTKSFRFGNNIEKIANGLLKELHCDVVLKGNGNSGGAIQYNSMKKPDVVICRTNSGCLDKLMEYYEADPYTMYGLSCNIAEITSFIKAYSALEKGEWFDHPILSGFDNMLELEIYVKENEDDIEVCKYVKLIKKFGEKRLLFFLNKCEKSDVCDLMITTAHKAKGLEWDNVLLSEDFPIKFKEGKLVTSEPELNLLYVATTRAKKNIDVGGLSELMAYLEMKYSIDFSEERTCVVEIPEKKPDFDY